MRKALNRARLLSLDVVSGAVVGAWTFAYVRKVNVDAHSFLLLAIAVWIIYTTDHLIDAFRVHGRSANGRHSYYYHNRKKLTLVLVTLIILALVLILFQPGIIILNGMWLSALVVLYFLLVNFSKTWSKYMKELSCAMLYTIGLMIPSQSTVIVDKNPEVLFLAGIYLLLAWLNLMIISAYEEGYDQCAGFSSLLSGLGMKNVNRLIAFLFLVVLALLGLVLLLLDGIGTTLVLLLAIMTVILFTVYRRPEWFGEKERYRLYGDAIFLLPVLLLVSLL